MSVDIRKCECGRRFRPITENQEICSNCKERKAHFDRLDTMTLEERIRRIEEWIYDYRPPTSIADTFFK